MSDLTRILQRAQQGDPNAASELVPLVYEELRRLAAAKMAQQPPGQTLQATALVHEAWLKLAGQPSASWKMLRHRANFEAKPTRRGMSGTGALAKPQTEFAWVDLIR